ncbi:hypothetical protein WH244_08115 [Sphingobacterium faecium]
MQIAVQQDLVILIYSQYSFRYVLKIIEEDFILLQESTSVLYAAPCRKAYALQQLPAIHQTFTTRLPIRN